MGPDSSRPPPGIFSIGHSNHSWQTFRGLLERHAIEVLADVRSDPYSKYASQFDMPSLRSALDEAGIRYVYLGRELGGRPEEDEYYDHDDRVLYWAVAQSPAFQQGLERLQRGGERFRVAMMCSEEDPAGCHRHRLIGRVLADRGIAVEHIRGDGSVQSAADLKDPQLGMFEELGEKAWKSIRPVSRRRPRPTSSEG